MKSLPIKDAKALLTAKGFAVSEGDTSWTEVDYQSWVAYCRFNVVNADVPRSLYALAVPGILSIEPIDPTEPTEPTDPTDPEETETDGNEVDSQGLNELDTTPALGDNSTEEPIVGDNASDHVEESDDEDF